MQKFIIAPKIHCFSPPMHGSGILRLVSHALQLATTYIWLVLELTAAPY